MTRTATALVLFAGLLSASYLARLDIDSTMRDAVVAEALPVYGDLGTSLILPLPEGQFASLSDRGWQVQILDTDLSPGDYFIIYKVGPGAGSFPAQKPEHNRQGRQERQAYAANARPAPPLCLGDLVVNSDPGSLVPGRVLWENNRLRLVRMPERDARAAKSAGFHMVQLSLNPHPLPPSPVPCPSPRYSADTTIARIVSLVSQDSLARTIQDLEDFGTRFSYYLKCESAAFYLRGRLTDLGYTTRLDTYYLQDPTTRAFNVEATLDGQVVPESIIVACGHFDSYNGDNQNAAPGANDDGTGTAAVIELARVLKQAQFRWSVKFLCFSGEEQWMKGSYHWVDSTAVPQGLKIAGAYNLDMFGFTPSDTNLLYVTRNAASLPLAVLAESANAWYDIGLHVVNFLDEDCAGDNTPFWQHGYRAVFACEDSEWGIWNGSDPHYHTDHDTFGNLRMGQVRRTSQLASACIATLAVPHDSVGVAEGQELRASDPRTQPTMIRGELYLPKASSRKPQAASLLDAAGRKVLKMEPGANDVRGLAPGVYFVRGNDTALRRVVKIR